MTNIVISEKDSEEIATIFEDKHSKSELTEESKSSDLQSEQQEVPRNVFSAFPTINASMIKERKIFESILERYKMQKTQNVLKAYIKGFP